MAENTLSLLAWEKSTVFYAVPKDITVVTMHRKIYFTEKGIRYSTLTTKSRI
jgi:hypothetical protein